LPEKPREAPGTGKGEIRVAEENRNDGQRGGRRPELLRWLPAQRIVDGRDGVLAVAEAGRQVPFEIRRVYTISGLSDPLAVRGRHAHYTLHQAIYCLNGAFTLALDNGREQTEVRLDDPGKGVYLPPFLWHEMKGFSPACVLLVLASDHYSEADYMRDYPSFLREVALD